MCTRYPIINRVSESKVHIELTRFVQPEKIEIDANERAVNEKSQYCFFVCTTFDSFLNDFTVLDTCPVTIGDSVFFGPNCTIATPMHPFRWQERNIKFKDDGTGYDDEYGKPITIGSNCWIASNVVITAGVTIGEGCVIGAGSVVTRDIPANSLAAGNPCRVIRQITEADSVKNRAELF